MGTIIRKGLKVAMARLLPLALDLRFLAESVVPKQGLQADQALGRLALTIPTQARLIRSTQTARLIIYLKDFSRSKASLGNQS